MKAKLLILSALSAFTLSAAAQKPDSARAVLHYKFTHLRDTTQKDKPYTENMELLLGSSASVYKSYDRITQMAAMRKQISEQMASGSGNIQIKSGGVSSRAEVYQFPNENKMVRKENLINDYLIEEPFPVINWKISSDTATFGALHCQKATAHFKGRDYIAWFCPDLPFRAGPWKLNGLPGLIVDAHDVKNEVIFKFDGIEEVTKAAKVDAGPDIQAPGGGKVMMFGMGDSNADPNLIAVPTTGIKTTEKEYLNLVDAMRKDPDAFLQSAMAGMRGPGGGDVHVLRNGEAATPGGANIKMKVGPQPVINNPIELPEGKK